MAEQSPLGHQRGQHWRKTIRARHVDLWLDHKNLGKLSMGHGSIAGDAGGLYDLSGVGFVYGFAGANGTDGTKADASVKVAAATDRATTPARIETVSATGKARGFRPFNFFGARENRIRYDTPSLMGARVSLSYNENKGWSAGLTYAGAPPGVKNFTALFASGYRNPPTVRPKTAWALSGGIKHNSSGFNVNGSYDTDGEEKAKGFQNSQWGVTLGWSGKINDNGATAIGVGFNRSSDGARGQRQSVLARHRPENRRRGGRCLCRRVLRQRLGDAYGDGSRSEVTPWSATLTPNPCFQRDPDGPAADSETRTPVKRRNAKSSATACSTSSSASA